MTSITVKKFGRCASLLMLHNSLKIKGRTSTWEIGEP